MELQNKDNKMEINKNKLKLCAKDIFHDFIPERMIRFAEEVAARTHQNLTEENELISN